MLFDGEFSSAYLFTIYLILGLFTLIGVCFSTYRLWLLSKPARKWLWNYAIKPLFDLTGSILNAFLGIIKVAIIKIVTSLILPPWRRIIGPTLKFIGSQIKKIPWGKCSLALFILCLSPVLTRGVGISFQIMLPIALAGATIGFILAPIFNWQLYKTKPWQGIAYSLMFIIGGAWSSPLFIATLKAMASD